MSRLPAGPGSRDIDDILLTSALLDVTEFQLFKTAYRQWYGAEPGVMTFHVTFADYMINGVVPFWVRSYTRKILGNRAHPRTTTGATLPSERIPAGQQNPSRPVAIFLVFLMLMFVALLGQQLSGLLSGCGLPACF